MAIKKIPCGGWSYDDTEIAFEDGVIHPIEKSELPEVTSADNGKVLGVVDGEWEKTEAGGGSGAMVVNITADGEGNYTFDKTFDEIVGAMPNVVCYITNYKSAYYFNGYDSSPSMNAVNFSTTSYVLDNNNIMAINVVSIDITETNEVVVKQGAKYFI